MKSLVFLVVVLAGCGPDEPVLARVGDAEITEAELEQFVERLPEHLRSKNQGVEADRKYLNSMIDQELLELEARARDLDFAAAVAGRMAAAERERLSERYQREVIGPKIVIAPEEIERAFHDMGFDRERLLSRIIVGGSEQDARAVLKQLSAGKPFAELAREYAENDAIADDNGNVDWVGLRGLKRFRISQREFFSLPARQAEIVLLLPEIWQIFRFEEDRESQLETYREAIVGLLRKEAWWRRTEEEVELLRSAHGTRYHPEAVQMLIQRAERETPLSDEQGKQPLYTFAVGGDTITVADYLTQIRKLGGNLLLKDSLRVVGIAEKGLLHAHLFARAGRERGWHEGQDFIAWREHTYTGILLDHLTKVEVEDNISMSENDLRAFYNDNPERFRATEKVDIEQAHVKDEAIALQYRAALAQGTSFEQLLHRPDVESHGHHRRGGKMTLEQIHADAFPELVEAAFAAKVGEVVGPIYLKGPNSYGLFRVLERHGSRIKPFEEARRSVEYTLHLKREEKLVIALFQSMREKYKDRIVIFDDRLEQRHRDRLQL